MKKYKFVLLGILIVILLICFFSFDYNFLKDDYYEAVNQELLKTNHIKEGEYTWSIFSSSQEKSDEKVESIVQNIIAGNELALEQKIIENIKLVYENATDMETRNIVGIDPIKQYLNRIFMSQNISELVENAILIENELGVDIFTRITVEADYIDNKENIVYFYPVTFSFGTSADYWVDANYMTYKAYVKRAMIEILMTYGYEKKEARNWVHQLVAFYENVGSNSLLDADFNDIKSFYHKQTISDLEKIYSHLNVQDYLKKRGLEEDSFSVVDVGQYQALNQYLVEDYLELWKVFILSKVLDHYAMYASYDYVDIVEKLNCSLMKIKENKDRVDEKAVDLIASLFARELDFIYVKEVMDSDTKEYILSMTSDIQTFYQKMLEKNSWLTEETKNQALKKLKMMQFHIGIDENTSFLGSTYQIRSSLQGGSLIENVIEVWQKNFQDELNQLKNNSRRLNVSQSQVNAYYNPLDNSIYIPAAIVYLFVENQSYYESLGSIGMILAHEMTHGFDGNGSQFDGNGNLLNWWDQETKEHFDKLKQQVISYYNKYEVLNGKYINGEKTVNENIADLGALSCITGIALEKNASKEELQKMFETFAKMWASQSSEEYMELLLLQDSHAPNKYRVNAVLSSTEAFYQVYEIHFWNDMYLSSLERVSVW